MYFPRVVRLDDSDARIYARPSRPGEWAVPGAFEFLAVDLERADGKTREAFRRGFLGTESFGWSTLVQVDEISLYEYTAVIERLAAHFVERHGAPDLETARVAAQEEAEFAASICSHPQHTLLALEREIGADGIAENFRVIHPPSGLDHERIKIWSVVADEESGTTDEGRS